MTIRQLPDFAFRSATDYADQMDLVHARYDPLFGTAGVGALERLGVFQVFRSPWFSAALVVLVLSIVCCTINRIPRLWRGVSDVRVDQPDPFFDPKLPDRAQMRDVSPDAVRRVFRKRGFRRFVRSWPTTGRASSTATGTSTRSSRRCSRTSA